MGNNAFLSYASSLMDTCEDGALQQRLGLYQVFLRLYEHNRDLLDEILSLENSGSKALAGVTLPYVQGLVLEQQVYLVTNLLQGKTQALYQPQHTWVVGRDPRQVTLPVQDKRLSRRHAAIKYVEGQGFYLIDLGSSNGSFVNGERIRQSHLLKDGDRIRLGSISIAFFLCASEHTLCSLPIDTLTQLEQWQAPVQSPFPNCPSGTPSLNAAANLQSSTVAAANHTALLDETYGFMESGNF